MRRLAIFLGIIFVPILVGTTLFGTAAWGQTSGPTSGQTPSRRTSPPDVFLITIDTLRADHLGCYGYKQVETPALDALAADERQLLPGQITLIPLHWVATAGLIDEPTGVHGTVGVSEAERAMDAAEAWWARREELTW